MEILIRNQNKAVIFSLILGLMVGMLYDFFKLLRKLVIPQRSLNLRLKRKDESTSAQIEETPQKPHKIAQLTVVALFDLSFCLLLCPIFCVFTYITVSGQFRWFVFAGALLGALTYKATLGRAMGIIIDWLSYLIFRLRRFVFGKIKKPLIFINGKIKNSRSAKRKKREVMAQKRKRKVVFSYGKGG